MPKELADIRCTLNKVKPEADSRMDNILRYLDGAKETLKKPITNIETTVAGIDAKLNRMMESLHFALKEIICLQRSHAAALEKLQKEHAEMYESFLQTERCAESVREFRKKDKAAFTDKAISSLYQ